MNRYTLLFLLLLGITAGCKKEIGSYSEGADGDVISRSSKTVKVTTIDKATSESGCFVETMRSGEIIQMCKPANWNGVLILYAHGYVSELEPLALPDEAQLYLSLFTSLGYAFATTSYSENGLAIQTGIDDILDLRKRFIKEFGEPSKVYLTGGSEGGLVTTLAVERYPKLFSGGLSLCSPSGDFQRQLNYFGDFRVLFDYFFPGILPGTVTQIPPELVANWESVYVPRILQAITADPVSTLQLLNVASAPYLPGNSTTIANTVIRLLWYDVFALPDAVDELKGQPYDNIDRVYSGTGSAAGDLVLNQQVQRVSGDKKALMTIEKWYETTGDISIPLVQPHTTGDPTIPFWHVPLYTEKTVLQGTTSLFTAIPIQRYGHCTFTEAEIVNSFALLVQQVEGQLVPRAQNLVELSGATKGKIVQSVKEEWHKQ